VLGHTEALASLICNLGLTKGPPSQLSIPAEMCDRQSDAMYL
jgi:hypothetical protein